MPDTGPKPTLTLPPVAEALEAKPGPKPMDEWRQAVVGRRPWFRRGEGEWGRRVLEGLKTLSWLVPLTLVIWLYAEREQTATRTGVTLTIAPPKDSATRIYKLLDPDTRTVQLELTGPQAGLDALERQLRAASGAQGVELIAPAVWDPGEHKLSIRNQLNERPEFKQHGVTVRSVTPDVVRLDVDDLQERELKVRPPPGLDLATVPTFSPSTIRVTAPGRVLALARPDAEGHLWVQAEMTERVKQLAADLARRPSDAREAEPLPGVPVSWPYGQDGREHVRFSASTVTATVVFRPREKRDVLETVGVQPTALVYILNQYTIEGVPQSVTQVPIAGPPEAVEMAKAGKYTVKAWLEVGPEDEAHANEPITRPLRFDLPTGVRAMEEKSVTFTLKKR